MDVLWRVGDALPVGRPLGAAAKMATVGRRGTIPPVGGKWPKAKGGRDKPPPYPVLSGFVPHKKQVPRRRARDLLAHIHLVSSSMTLT